MNARENYKLPIAETNHHGCHECPVCKKEQDTKDVQLPVGVYKCKTPNCETTFEVK